MIVIIYKLDKKTPELLEPGNMFVWGDEHASEPACIVLSVEFSSLSDRVIICYLREGSLIVFRRQMQIARLLSVYVYRFI